MDVSDSVFSHSELWSTSQHYRPTAATVFAAGLCPAATLLLL